MTGDRSCDWQTGPVVTQEDLGRELKGWLRHGPGRRPKVSLVAKRIDVSPSTLYAYLAGTTLPPTDVLDALMLELQVPRVDQRRLATARDALERQRRRAKGRGVASVPVPVPQELPADPTGFSGREPELQALEAGRQAVRDGGPPVAVLSGPAGVGKSALAVRWAHQVSVDYPDGCLYVDLLGFAPSEPRPVEAVLAGFLRSLGVEDDIPDDPRERGARFRSAVAGRRVLIVLDNALDVEQVRPLLPGHTGCFVVVTSRDDLRGLHVQPGAAGIAVSPLADADSLDLVRSQLDGPEALEADVLRGVVRRCAGLPLALRIAAAQMGRRPDVAGVDPTEAWGDGLDMFDVGDESTSVRAVFSWSEQRLPREADRAFRLLGGSPLHDHSLAQVAALLGTGRRTARARLGDLVRAHLVEQPRSGRVQMHDLIREYAREQAAEHLTYDEREAANDRLIDWLIARAGRAAHLLHPAEDSQQEGPEPDAPGFGTVSEAKTWVDAEWDNLIAALQHSAAGRQFERTGRLVDLLRRHILQGEGHFGDGVAVLRHGLAASEHTGNHRLTGHLLRDLGAVHLRLGRNEESRHWFRRALDLSREDGDRNGEAGALNNLGNAHLRASEVVEAVEYYEQALTLARAHDMVKGQAVCVSNLAVCHMRLGCYDHARSMCEETLTLHEGLGDHMGTARAHCILGEVARRTGDLDGAVRLLDLALTQARGVGAVVIEVEALNTLGETHRGLGAYERAVDCHRAAWHEAHELGDGYEQGRALEGIGLVWQQVGEGDRARGAWRDAELAYGRLPEAARVRELSEGLPPSDAADDATPVGT